jgi:hypothetical protein
MLGQTTQTSAASLFDNILHSYWQWGLVLVFLFLVAILRSRAKKRVHVPDDIGAQGISQYVAAKYDTIIKNMRSGDSSLFFYALLDAAYVKTYREDVIRELAFAAGKADVYRDFAFLDNPMQCRAARFLHLALERNSRVSRGAVANADIPRAEDVYNDCSYCSSLSTSESKLKRFFDECLKVAESIPEKKP